MAKQDSMLQKDFDKRDIERIRNLIKKDYNARTVRSAGYQTKEQDHKEGETWEEDNRTWTIKNGIKQNITVLDEIKEMARTPLTCPKCGGTMKHHLSKKMYKIHRMCFDCVVKYETSLRRAGLYEEYERAMIQGSVEAWAKDLEDYVTDLIQTETSFVTEDGDVEDWEGKNKSLKERALKNLKEYTDHIRKALEK